MEIWRCPARAVVDVQAGSSQNVPNSRLRSVCQCNLCYSRSAQFLHQWLWTFCFLHLLLVAGDEESTVRNSLSDEAFNFLVCRHFVCDTKPNPQHQGRFFLQVLGNKWDWHTFTCKWSLSWHLYNVPLPGRSGSLLGISWSGSHIPWHNSDIHKIYIPSRSLPRVNMA